MLEHFLIKLVKEKKLKIEISNYTICDNSNEIQSGDLFIVTSLNSKYIDSALSNGATVIYPSDLNSYFDFNSIKIVGVCGTNGKTTTSAGIYSTLLDLGYKVALSGTRGFFINDEKIREKGLTTPTLLENYVNIELAKNSGCEFFIMEISSHAIAQKRVEGLNFTLKVHTNITSDHLDFHKSLNEYIKIKNSFFADETLKLINRDDKNIVFNYKNANSYGVESPATFKVVAYSLNDGISAVVNYANESAVFHSELVGLFNLYNLMAVIGSVKLLTECSLEEIAVALENFLGVSGRVEVVNKNPLIIVDFAHTEDGFIKIFEAFKTQEIVVVFGAGGDRDKEKRAKMGAVASRYAKRIFVTSDNPRSENAINIADEIVQGISDISKAKIVIDRKLAIEEAIKSLKNSEVLLILGKGDEEYQIFADTKVPFSDTDVVKNFLKSE